MKFNNILKVILLSKFCLCSAFISNLHIKKSNLKLNAVDNPASIISKFGVGNEWTYNQFLDKINNNEIDGVSILSDEKGLAVIDKLHTDDILSNNIHYIKILPNMINDIIIQLNSHHVTYDILKIPESNGFDFSLPLKFVGK